MRSKIRPVSKMLFGLGLSLGTTHAAAQCLWVEVDPAASPPARLSAGMAYDSARARTILFGGSGPFPTIFGDTWEYDGATWTQRVVSGPPARHAHGMTYDSARQRIVVFGGVNGTTNFGDTWEWNGAAWNQVASTGPAAGVAELMTFDVARARSVVHVYAAGANQTWEWDGAAWALRASGPALTTMGNAGFTYDAVRSRAVLTNGGTTYEWDGAAWTLIPVSPSPVFRNSPVAAFESVTGKTIFFGGVSSSNDVRDTWSWNGTSWSLIANVLPGMRWGARMVFDSARGRLVMFGGVSGGNGTHYQDETWEYNPAATQPGIIVTQQPSPLSLTPGQTAVFTAAAQGAGTLTYRWRRSGTPLFDGGTISGAATPSLTINGVTATDEGLYDVLITDQCGSGPSAAAALGIAVDCYANCDGSIVPPRLNANDFQCFLHWFAVQDPKGNCDGSTAPPTLNANDFQCFMNAYAVGCT